ncbi:FAD:protein FMN transferase [Novosphingobium mangrovi (ex Huang et al. 2023)]|uniref:FAD:protein FMN transferase n=1 Tax=Novosphingobium mangrovi (ex Huang et al. 2023) TaxID=2976432 RepID=A0ABT2I0V2_9SPHN|nr:FAD:protein FMN transferase [Novosphingobium mangrovi (ex Huang et al. 2023)]MCT2398435.1 FAD:protein FMN transferase [Novosphingobium mangrovi (ex Huang et al. 2023)]
MRIAIPPLAETDIVRPAGGGTATFGGQTMGTTWSVRLVADPDEDLSPLKAACEDVLGTIVGQMSQWEPDSLLSRYNRAVTGSWHALPGDFARVLAEALDVAALTDGAFDPTVGAASEAWGFGSRAVAGLPDAAACDAIRGATGWQAVDFDRFRARLRQPGGLRLDFSAIAKGYGVDRLAETLAAYPVASFLVEIGGELRGAGLKPDGQPWWVDVEPGEEGADSLSLRVALSGWAIATSGHSRRFHLIDGQRLGHTIDPASGAPSTSGMESVSVVERSAMRADALATALMVLGPQACDFARAHGIAARMLLGTGADRREIVSPSLQRMFE